MAEGVEVAVAFLDLGVQVGPGRVGSGGGVCDFAGGLVARRGAERGRGELARGVDSPRRLERQQRDFRTWVQRIKGNHCLNFIRKRKDRVFVDAADPVTEMNEELHEAPEAPREMEADEQVARISATLEALPDKLRVALVLRDLDEMSYQDIADVLNIGLSATKMRIKRAREEFRRLHDRKGD